VTKSEQSATRLVAVDDLGASQVTVVETFPVEVREGAIWLVG
jgi:hypothetical protein